MQSTSNLVRKRIEGTLSLIASFHLFVCVLDYQSHFSTWKQKISFTILWAVHKMGNWLGSRAYNEAYSKIILKYSKITKTEHFLYSSCKNVTGKWEEKSGKL